MDMRVDEAGHQGLALEIDRRGTGGFDRPLGDLSDGLALDDDIVTRQQHAGDRVEHRAILEMNERHRFSPTTSWRCRGRGCATVPARNTQRRSREWMRGRSLHGNDVATSTLHPGDAREPRPDGVNRGSLLLQ